MIRYISKIIPDGVQVGASNSQIEKKEEDSGNRHSGMSERNKNMIKKKVRIWRKERGHRLTAHQIGSSNGSKLASTRRLLNNKLFHQSSLD